ncbi:MAG: transglycosylase SLT domain-containing protein [Bacteroidota bacterium]
MSNVEQHITHAQKNGYLPYYYEASTFYNIPVELLLAKDSRESGLGSYPGLVENGWYGSDGISRGISQINENVFRFARGTDPSDVRAYVAMGAQVLSDEIKRFNGNVKHALVAYNAGPDDVYDALDKNQDPDSRTTKGNYAADVLNRSNQIKRLLSSPTGGLVQTQHSPTMAGTGVLLALTGLGYAAWRWLK